MLAATLLVVLIVLLPIWKSNVDYPFYFSNILFIVVFITLSRYIFLWKHNFFARNLVFKVIVIFTAIPFIFYLIDGLSAFQGFADDKGLQTLVNSLDMPDQSSMIKYIRTEMLFFGVGAVIVAILFPLRMLISIWRVINKNTT